MNRQEKPSSHPHSTFDMDKRINMLNRQPNLPQKPALLSFSDEFSDEWHISMLAMLIAELKPINGREYLDRNSLLEA